MPPTPPYVQTLPYMSPMLPCASLCSRGFLHVIWGCRGPSLCLDSPMYLNASPCVQNSLHLYVPLYVYVLGLICMCCGGTPHMLGVWQASAHLSGFWCLSVHPYDVHYASSCTFLVVHYVSGLYYHGIDYYSSSDCDIFWFVGLPTMLG